MKKLMLVILMGGLMASVQSAPTIYTDTYNFGDDGLIWDAQNHSWADLLVGSNQTVDWSHQLPVDLDLMEVTSADLTISGQGIDNILCDWDGDGPNEKTDSVKVYLNDTCIGNITGDVTKLALTKDILEQTNFCSATIRFSFDRNTTDVVWPVDTVRLTSSMLTVSTDGVSSLPTVVPAPGAMAIASIGAMIVGFLRNRKTI
jgi:hypothetical protein